MQNHGNSKVMRFCGSYTISETCTWVYVCVMHLPMGHNLGTIFRWNIITAFPRAQCAASFITFADPEQRSGGFSCLLLSWQKACKATKACVKLHQGETRIHPVRNIGGKMGGKQYWETSLRLKERLFTANRNVCLVENGEGKTELATWCSNRGFFIYPPRDCGPCQDVRFGLFDHRGLMVSLHIMITLTLFCPTAEIKQSELKRTANTIIANQIEDCEMWILYFESPLHILPVMCK